MAAPDMSKLPDFEAFEKFLEERKEGMDAAAVVKVAKWAAAMKEWAVEMKAGRDNWHDMATDYEEELSRMRWTDNIIELLEDCDRGIRTFEEVMAEVRG